MTQDQKAKYVTQSKQRLLFLNEIVEILQEIWKTSSETSFLFETPKIVKKAIKWFCLDRESPGLVSPSLGLVGLETPVDLPISQYIADLRLHFQTELKDNVSKIVQHCDGCVPILQFVTSLCLDTEVPSFYFPFGTTPKAAAITRNRSLQTAAGLVASTIEPFAQCVTTPTWSMSSTTTPILPAARRNCGSEASPWQYP